MQISGSFTETQAKTLATELTYGALPVKLDRLTVQTVSPTLGKASLQAGLISGLAGLLLVMLYMVFYYRMLGVVVIAGLAVTGALLWAIISVMGQRLDTTIDLAGVIGIIVSIGYHRRLLHRLFRTTEGRDAGRAGRCGPVWTGDSPAPSAPCWPPTPCRCSVPSSSTEFSIGPVQGFALFLGHLDAPRHLRHLLLHPALRDPARAQPQAAVRSERHERGQRPGRDRGGTA